MLGKLLKHEIKHSARYIMLIYAAVLAAAGVTGISMLTQTGWLGVLGCFALYTVGFAAIIVTLVSVIKNFYDTLYARQGYLTFTLPVKCSTLLLSKVIVSVMWIIVSFILMAFNFYVIYLYGKSRSGGTIDSMWSIISMSGLLDMLPSGKVMVETLIVIAVIILVTVLTYVGYVYFTVTIANTRRFQSHPKLFGGLTFFAITVIVNGISNKLTEFIPLTFNVTNEKILFSFSAMGEVPNAIISYGIGGTIFSGVVAVALLFLTGYIMENKVNLK